MSEQLGLTADEVLATTRAVRRRLDLSRQVAPEVVLECLALAQQAPNANGEEAWRFIVVTDPGRRSAIAAQYRRAWDLYEAEEGNAHTREREDPDEARRWDKQVRSARYLTDNLEKVPVFVIPCVSPRVEGESTPTQSALWASILPASWSFMLAARARGLGTCWTTGHLFAEREVAQILDIPYDDVMQVGLIPVAYTKGTDFRPAERAPLDTIVYWDAWGQKRSW
ncbi:putative oxidoreductase [Acrocarpospora pleiomorpha]|uniref:Putative oxidoreductase n=1 Tax=Acrocarpospora pleiomorpha TaxID=90975 RepID=A0A5M3XXA2_9ACTN|nr:nitroreductase family protein [Acrocarpospora pleiomorpha]GES24689.1 putative oxidoreductase [Acrocarpospora pleiomorpha]